MSWRSSRSAAWLAVLVASAVLLAGCVSRSESGAGTVESDQPIKLGMFGPLTGASSWVGLANRDGFQLALDEINAKGGVNGRPLHLVSVDDEGTPAGALAAAQRLVDREGVFALVGGSTSTGVLGVVQYAEQQNVPLIATATGGDGIVDPLRGNVFVAYGPSNKDYGRITADFVADYLQGATKKVAVINATDEQPKSTSQAAIDSLKNDHGIDVVARAEGKLGDRDWTAQLLQVQQAGAEIVLLNVYTQEAALILQQAAELGITAQFVGDPATTTRAVIDVAGQAAENYISGYLLNDLVEAPVSPTGQDWVQRWKAAYPNPAAGRPNYLDPVGYATAYVIAEGLKNAGANVSRDSFRAGLEQISDLRIPGPFFPVTFGPQRHVAGADLSFATVKGGAFQLLPWSRPGA